MPRTCSDCGLCLSKKPGPGKFPKRCMACAAAHQSDCRKRRADKISSIRAEERKSLCCKLCHCYFSSTSSRGRLPKFCQSCAEVADRHRKSAARAEGRGKFYEKTCGCCAASFLCRRSEQKFCSPICSRVASRKRSVVACGHCGSEFELMAMEAGKTKYCSRACFWASRRRPDCRCVECGKNFRPRSVSHAWQGKNKFCSRECAWDNRWGRDRPRISASSSAKKNWSQRVGTTTLKHRCRHYGCDFDPMCTRGVVCERDAWVCQQCGVQCHKGKWRIDPKTRRADPRNAEHDHIWPLSVPGSPGNVMSNSQCLCRSCNGKKRNKMVGQMRLNLVG